MRADLERHALQVSACAICGHALITHHETTLRCQHRTKPHWWSRTKQCTCDMRMPK